MTRRQQGLIRTLALPGASWLLLLYLVPVGILVATAFASVDLVGRPVLGSWHVGHVLRVFEPVYLSVLLRSLLYALVATAVCVVLGYIVAYTIARFGGRARNLLILLVIVPWFVDYLIRVYAWVQLLSDDGIIMGLLNGMGIASGVRLFGTPFALLIGFVYSYLPFMILPVYLVLERMDLRLIEAGRDLYHSNLQTFSRVTLPLSLPAVATGATVVFLFSFTDFAIPAFLGGPDQYMIGNLIQDQFRNTGAMPFGAALTFVMLVSVVLVMLILSGLSAWAKRRAR